MSAVPTPDQPVLLREDRDGTCTLTFNRPQQMNLLTSEMLAALQKEFDSIKNDRDVRVVVLTGTGRGFSAGHDLKEIKALKELPKIEALFNQCSRMMQSIPMLPQPVIAKVQGMAAAAGCQLVAQCDLAIAVDTAKFVTSGVNWGFFCSTPGVAVGRNLQRKHAMEMLLTGEAIDARRALEWGLVNRVVPAEELDSAVNELARNLASKPPATVAAGKRAFYQQMDLSLEQAYKLASGVISASFAHEEGRAGMDAFIEKRPPPKHWVDLVGYFKGARTLDVPAGVIVFQEGEPGKDMYVLLQGTAQVSIGGDTVELAKEGSLFGEMALVDSGARSATVTTVTACRFVSVDARQFDLLVRESPQFARHVMKIMAERLRRMNERLREAIGEVGVHGGRPR